MRASLYFIGLLCCVLTATDKLVGSQQLDEAGETSETNIVVLRALDKITARISEIEISVEQEFRFGTLLLTPKYCRKRPPIEPPETFAYLVIEDVKRTGERDKVFEGWMLASSPALNPLEHPIYDVWVIDCKTSAPEG